MIVAPERSNARDAVIDKVADLVPTLGWSVSALRQAGGDAALRLFPGGAADVVEAFIDLMDRRMVAAAAPALATARLSARVRVLIATRLKLARDQKAAIRRAALFLAQPRHGALAARCTARTVDTIWHAAGDRSADFAWYTKRAILAWVYSATLLYWMRDSASEAESLDFLDRRLADVLKITKWRARLTRTIERPAPA